MNDQLQNTINTILIDAIDKAKQGAEFLAGQIPDVVQQLIKWNVALDIVQIYVGVLFTSGSLYAMKKFYNKYKQQHTYDCWEIGIMFSGGAAGIAALVTLFAPVCDLIKLNVAPKLWLIEYAAHLIGK